MRQKGISMGLNFKQKRIKEERQPGMIRENNQGYLMKLIEYNGCSDILVEFQDEWKGIVHTSWQCFESGKIKNPFHIKIYNVGVTGQEIPTRVDKIKTEEYKAWNSMLRRCYSKNEKNKFLAYQNCTVCDEWLYFPNFYAIMNSKA